MKTYIYTLLFIVSLTGTKDLKASSGYDSLIFLNAARTHQFILDFNSMQYEFVFDRDFNFILNDSIKYGNSFPTNAGIGLIQPFVSDSLLVLTSIHSNNISLKLFNMKNLEDKSYFIENSKFLFYDNTYMYYQKYFKGESNGFTSTEPYNKGLYRLNYITGEQEEVNDILGNVMYLAALNEKIIFVYGSYIEGGDILCPSEQLYEFDKHLLELTQLNNSHSFTKDYYKYNSYHSNYCAEINEEILYRDYFYHALRIDSEDNPINYNILYNYKFEEIGKIPERSGKKSQEIKGYILRDNELKGFYFNSVIDSLRFNSIIRVRIPVHITPYFDISAFKIINNIKINPAEIISYTTEELRLLRNFIFAKHNYGFQDKYLQAFFNLYSFYTYNNIKNRNRLSDINHLLTPADKANLELIRAAEERANGIED